MPMSGAGSITKAPKPIGRGYKRNLRAVSADYEQDEIVYQEGFWAQYGAKSVLCIVGALTCVLLWLFAMSPWARLGDVWGMAPTLMFTLFMGPLMMVTPLVWYRIYLKQQRVLEGLDEVEETTQIESALE